MLTPEQAHINKFLRLWGQMETPRQRQYALEVIKERLFGCASKDKWFHAVMLGMEESTETYSKLGINVSARG